MEKKLKSWRTAKGLTQKQAAERLNVPLSTYRNWEQKRNQPIGLARQTLLRIIERENK
ncbi:MAG TPA: helix-turn-helix domain-containing protein [Chthoniobacterales bacterium]|nr:helix-turn-helix domain-containing protein [Chthoniobacterales bacterium]